MYYIYIDETYNLTHGTPNQLIVLGGFGTSDPKKIAKAYKKIRKFTLKRRQLGQEIKSSDKIAIKKLIPKVFKALTGLDIIIYVIRQDKKFIPFQYYKKNKLDYEKLYLDLLIKLLKEEWNLEEHNQVSVILDTFKTKKISKDEMIKKICSAFKERYPNKYFKMRFVDSAGDLNIQIADFIVGSFSKAFKGGPKIPNFKFEGLRLRIINNIL